MMASDRLTEITQRCSTMSYWLGFSWSILHSLADDKKLPEAQKEVITNAMERLTPAIDKLFYNYSSNISHYHCGNCTEEVANIIECPCCGNKGNDSESPFKVGDKVYFFWHANNCSLVWDLNDFSLEEEEITGFGISELPLFDTHYSIGKNDAIYKSKTEAIHAMIKRLEELKNE